MAIQPGSKNSSLQVKKPVATPASASPAMQKLVKEAQKIPGQVRAMSQAINQKPTAKPTSPGKK